MNRAQSSLKALSILMNRNYIILALLTLSYSTPFISNAQYFDSKIGYTVTMKNPEQQHFQMQLNLSGFQEDTLELKLPNWSPGYYQFMDYAKDIQHLSAIDENGKSLTVIQIAENGWQIISKASKAMQINYQVHTPKKFVANSFLDSTHAYIVPTNNFLYPGGYLDHPSQIHIKLDKAGPWDEIATGLDPLPELPGSFIAKNYDILFDSPLLIGDLQSLTPFKVRDIEHRFIGYQLGEFDKQSLMRSLQKIVTAAVDLFDDIPYDQYTFIGIGPGRGGIEHLNSTTVSFDGNQLKSKEAMDRMLNFLSHEYFHHYNAKRIRPFELGPFDYDLGSRTNQLWIAEGLTVYYEYLISKKAGIKDAQMLYSDLETHINALENNPGRMHQSLSQSSYNTWQDGPFGNMGEKEDKTISYYNKGPLVGLILDLEIRKVTDNKASLNDVMYTLYHTYYKGKGRGFTAAEFQAVCEQVASFSLSPIFEYVNTTKELNYQKYLSYAGLTLDTLSNKENKINHKHLYIKSLQSPTQEQLRFRNAWLNQ